MLGLSLARNRAIEHSAQYRSIDITGMSREADDATRELIHHDQHPVRFQQYRLAAKQIDTPETVLGVANYRKPRWPTTTGPGSKVLL
jgi:hypothetical protein